MRTPRRSSLARFGSVALLTAAYGFAIVIAKLVPRAKRSGTVDEQRALVIGTFHNPNWFAAHVVPLANSGLTEIFLVADGFVATVPGVRVLVPPPWAPRLLTRAGAKALYALWYGIKLRPSLYMGYAIFPAATIALVLGRLLRGFACFQLTSGALELDGGGYRAENKALSALGRRSAWTERLAHALTREFDLLIVRGSGGRNYARQIGYAAQMDTITGSVEIPESERIDHVRDIDMIFVGRLTERKRPSRFIEIASAVARRVPHLRAVLVGDGPDHVALAKQVTALGLQDQVRLLGVRGDVTELLCRSKVFVLTSRWEGVSIAMMEAMAAGAVPVANDVGDLTDFLEHGRNGYLVEDDDIESAVKFVIALLRDDNLRQSLASAARQTVTGRCSRDTIGNRWRDALARLFDQS